MDEEIKKEANPQQIANEQFKRNIAYKFRIGQIIEGVPIIEEERLRFLEIQGRRAVRVNIIANITDKFIQEGEKKFGSITIDDASGQIKLKAFGDDVDRFNNYNQGETVLIIGLLRSWNNEVYITPEIIKKKDPSFLLVRKLEIEAEQPKISDNKELHILKDKILEMIKQAESDNGIEVEKMILDLKEHPSVINNEIKKLLEEGLVYEPRPGKLRYLG